MHYLPLSECLYYRQLLHVTACYCLNVLLSRNEMSRVMILIRIMNE